MPNMLDCPRHVWRSTSFESTNAQSTSDVYERHLVWLTCLFMLGQNYAACMHRVEPSRCAGRFPISNPFVA